jgi:hypothetical protein
MMIRCVTGEIYRDYAYYQDDELSVSVIPGVLGLFPRSGKLWVPRSCAFCRAGTMLSIA